MDNMLHQQVRKAVIPVAGLGSRLLPITKAIPKEMLPLIDKPLIHYVVYEAVAAGIDEIVFVTHASKGAIARYFDRDDELEAELERRGEHQLLAALRAIHPPGATLKYVFQESAQGLGHAVLCARSVVGDEPFALLLPDVLIDDAGCDTSINNLAAMIATYDYTGHAQIMVERVDKARVDQYGIADVGRDRIAPGESRLLLDVVEKPPVDKAPSNLAVVGRYVLPPAIWPLLEGLPADKEIELTDALALLVEQRSVEAFYLLGQSHDCGHKKGYLQTCLHYAMQDPSVGDVLAQEKDRE